MALNSAAHIFLSSNMFARPQVGTINYRIVTTCRVELPTSYEKNIHKLNTAVFSGIPLVTRTSLVPFARLSW
jgi:hypothetical protein